ncbi:MAG: histidine phosphatase family protein [bacterium]
MTRIVLVRHGRTEWNRDEIFRGTIDVPLDEQGRTEAACARDWLRGDTFHAAISSPLSRAVETAQIILEPHGIPVVKHAGLTDIDFGEWQSKSLHEVKRDYAELYRMWKERPQDVFFPKGEGLGAVRDRALEAIGELVRRHPGQSVLVAAHRVVNKVLIASLLGLDNSHFWQIGQDTAALNEFVFDQGTWICRRINDTCHLRTLQGCSTRDF